MTGWAGANLSLSITGKQDNELIDLLSAVHEAPKQAVAGFQQCVEDPFFAWQLQLDEAMRNLICS
ncbi:MAG: hypothetical protein ACOY3P_11050 [Planctomycetota bacterium]